MLALIVLVTPISMNSFGQEPGSARDNPFSSAYGTPFNTPPFDRIRNEDYLPAIKEGIRPP